MSWTKTEHATIKGIQRQVDLLVNVIRGNLDRPDEPGMVETLRTMEGQMGTVRDQITINEQIHTGAHRRFKKLLAAIGMVAFIALVLQWKYAAGLMAGLLELAIKWAT